MLPSVAVNLLCEKAIKAIAAGKPEEIGVLYDHTYRLIYSVAYGVLRNHADAEDTAQETLCKILECASSYQGGSAKGWILSIARHTALDMVKKQSRIHLTEEELPAAREVLSAAALTYLASLVTSLVYFLRFFFYVMSIFGRRRR